MLVSCGGKQEGVNAPRYLETTAAVTSAAVTSSLPELSVEVVEEAPETDSIYEPDNRYDEDDGGSKVAELKLDKDKIDPTKPLVPDKSELGSGCTYYAYPMNSIMLWLYEAPSPKAKRTVKLLSGSEVTLLATVYFGYSDSWSYISCEGGNGWCRSRDITATSFGWVEFEGLKLPENCYEHADYSEGIYEVTADTGLYTSPDSGSEKRGTIKKGNTIRAFGDDPSAKGWLFAAVSAEYMEEGGTGEMYGWVDTQGGKTVSAVSAGKGKDGKQ